MLSKISSRPDVLLLASLILVILLNPVLDRGDLRRLILTALTFVPVVFSTITLSTKKKKWLFPSVLLMAGVVVFGIISIFLPNRAFLGMKWGLLAAFFAVVAIGLFSHIRNARSITGVHLCTAVSIYLLLGMLWFALYCGIDTISPGSFGRGANARADRQSELMYFSLVTLSTIGYGDVVALQDEARMLAALEGVTGVLYIAITVALLVSAYKPRPPSSET